MQSFGYNGFSFQHIADELGIKKPSLYDHFSSKEELGNALVQDYFRYFADWTKTIQVLAPEERVRAFFALLTCFSADSARVCPLLALVADFHSLPKSMQNLVSKMLGFQEQWLAGIIAEGQKKKVFRKDRTARNLARLLMSVSFGSQWLARVEKNPATINDLQKDFLALISL